MKTILWLSLFSFAVPCLVQAQAEAEAENPKYVLDKENGFIIKRPSGDKWACKKPGEGDGAFFNGTAAIVYHRMDDCAVQILVSKNQNNLSSNSLKEMAEGQIKSYEGEGKKVVTKMNIARNFPGAGAPRAQYVEVMINEEIYRQYFFVDKRNQKHLYIVTITGDADTYKKHRKKIRWILASIRTARVNNR